MLFQPREEEPLALSSTSRIHENEKRWRKKTRFGIVAVMIPRARYIYELGKSELEISDPDLECSYCSRRLLALVRTRIRAEHQIYKSIYSLSIARA